MTPGKLDFSMPLLRPLRPLALVLLLLCAVDVAFRLAERGLINAYVFRAGFIAISLQ
jgi:hypothetical protein